MDPSTRRRIDAAAMALRRSLGETVRDGSTVAARAAELSQAYRSGAAKSVVLDAAGADAYAVSRMPATFAASALALAAAADRARAFAPTSHLDLGAGTGAAAWAARAVWPSLERATLLDRAETALDTGRRVAAASRDEVLASGSWRVGRLGASLAAADLVTAGYVLGELEPDELGAAIDAAWAATRGVLVLVEPGSRAGFSRVIPARERLVGAGARVVAPCPGAEPCPVAGSRTTWCHFLARLDRSPGHRRAKAATRSWEDEPFSYVAVARPAVVADPRPRVVLGRPRRHPGRVELRICTDGRIEVRIVSRRAGETWRVAKDLDWGDLVATQEGARGSPTFESSDGAQEGRARVDWSQPRRLHARPERNGAAR
jgi:ribosomal protein RSM22 (predicted rRNA methylase)